ncbi:uncharacterized protein BO97DRAFT_343081 [Aspergillus homomorphus CBS 101889]|uniref:CBM-cenC domain-containing protein n=1 Tax=Aspergillus homomorphus (strain CBS 101889) TaxID=1450537 RepID=A0A395I2X5_ASPHC|nr:hypothetical protein BO97DRAFT_343081 [Aspergillus homomorphus CBS 101889]RAL13538.1 hypothetical protein BO97DRAFT_343081 [Aspergillus homomorphus CBS 101889]
MTTATLAPVPAPSTIVSCTTAVPNAIQNPSFENGFTNWGYASGTSGSVVSGDAADGDYYLEASGNQARSSILFYQFSQNLVGGKTYTASLDWAISPSTTGQLTCRLYWYMDRFGSSIGSTSVTVPTAGMGWTPFSATYTPTTDGSHLVEIYAYCQSSNSDWRGAAIKIDNLKLSDGVAVTSCVTSTVTPTATPVLPTSSVVVTSSSSVIVPTSLVSSSPVASIIPSSSVVSLSIVPSNVPSSFPSSIPSSIPSSGPSSVPSNIRSSSVVSFSPSASAIPSSSSVIVSQPGRPLSSSALVQPSPSSSPVVSPSATSSRPLIRTTSTANAGTVSRQTGSSPSNQDFTTSTVFTTRTATITACPSSVTDCPVRSRTTYLTTETVLVSTTICPITEAGGSTTTTTTAGSSNGSPAGASAESGSGSASASGPSSGGASGHSSGLVTGHSGSGSSGASGQSPVGMPVPSSSTTGSTSQSTTTSATGALFTGAASVQRVTVFQGLVSLGAVLMAMVL